MFNKIFIFLFFSISFVSAQNEDDLALEYYKKGEYEKALISYKELLKEKPYSYDYFNKIIDIHQELEQYKEADSLINLKLIRGRLPYYVISLGYNYQLQNKSSQAEKLYEEAISLLDNNPNYVYTTGERFENYSLYNYAIKTYNKGKVLLPERNFSVQLARIYADRGDVEQMFSNYLDYIDYKPAYTNNVKGSITGFISENSENESNRLLKKLLLKRLQESPEIYWNQMLSWLYVQEKSYKKSFVQEKAIYKRFPERLDRIVELAIMSKDDDDKETATEIFNYILENTFDIDTQILAHQYLLEFQTDEAKSQKELGKVKEAYEAIIKQYERQKETLDLQIDYGNFLAFYFNRPKEASNYLKKSLKLNLSKFQQAQVKMKLADILVYQERFNEALIYYTQIQKSLKNSTLGQEARFRVAKTSYYNSDFDWAETQLNILKSSTSQLIANDALDLKLLISDNKFEDSTRTALNYFAKADLLSFQKRDDDAIKLLQKILNEHQGESMEDQALLRQAQLFESKNQFEKAADNYKKIIENYPDDILADDAHFFLARLFEKYLDKPNEAKSLYEYIIFNYQDSIYFVEARKAFRRLRGDDI